MGVAPPTSAETMSRINYAAMSLLAMREHSIKELQQKLLRKFEDLELIDLAIDNLKDRDLQSDTRFAYAYIQMKIRQGKGPVRIGYDLREKGVDQSLIETAISEHDDEWCALAKEIKLRKFGSGVLSNQERAKQMRFLQYRGFTLDQIRAAYNDA
jgi:regulatory protein